MGEFKLINNTYYKSCLMCGSYFKTKKSHVARRKTCSKECNGFMKVFVNMGESNPNYGNRGNKNPLFKTGEYISNYGYRMVLSHGHPNSHKSGYAMEHRIVMSEHIGRPLRNDEHIHHIDGNKLNNDITNLEITSLSEHTKLHNLNKELVRDKLGRIVGVITKEDE